MRKQEEQHQSSQGSVTETVLVLQGGGSLGAYECGVYKTLANHGIKFDILAGSSIGAINSSIICSAQNADKDAAQVLEGFWLTLAENNVPPSLLTYSLLPFASLSSTLLSADKMMAILSSIYSVTYGNPKAFTPRWFKPDSSDYFLPYKWNYLYDATLLKNTLNEYIDFTYLNNVSDSEKKSQGNNTNDLRSRLIITATDIQKGEPVIFDSYKMDIDADSIVACAGYPFYGIQWSTKDGRYLWDGSLLTNTPMLEAIKASPEYNKKFYIVDVFPREQKELPTNMVEVWHRARDIIFMDKTTTNIEMLKIRERYLSLLKKIYIIINADDAKIDEKSKAKFKEIESEYNELVHGYGAVIEEVIRIGRIEKMHYLFEDGDFSAYRVKKLIREGEEDAMKALTQEKRG
ncbi:MAG: patatin-like phospholipase family protein [Thermoproteota archaeon]|nr:patatin-like phospholipase family protein [Thermoproteota archaeon]